MTYADALAYIYSFTNFEITPASSYGTKTFDLSRMQRLLAALGNPHAQFKSVHIAGTKGKGSTAAMVESILRTAGYRTSLYTSPHLHSFRERIRVDGQLIPEDAVVAGVERLRPIVAQLSDVTSFEIMTALAFAYFRQMRVELAVLEVGLGGRLDATNVVTPLVSVITSISYDHTAVLGQTLAEIAREKAGIIKPNVPAVTAPQRPEALAVVEASARAQSAPLTVISPELKFEIAGGKYQVIPDSEDMEGQTFLWMRLDGTDLDLETWDLSLLGHHQLANAATALAAALVLRERGVAIPNAALRDGIANTRWQGRFEILGREPFIVVDGAHNADSAHQLVQTLTDVFPRARVHLIFGAYKDKDVEGMFRELLPYATSLILTRTSSPRATDPTRLADLAEPYHVETSVAPDLGAALHAALARAQPEDVVCLTGSLSIVAQARELWFAEHGQPIDKDS